MESGKQIARVKLAGTYLAIIMGMSIVFSLTIYNLSDRELRGQRQLPVPQQTGRPAFIAEFDRLREIQLQESRSILRERLIGFNIITLVFGGILSYLLALRALRPIEEAMDAQNRFTSDASHEIRTPLTAMRSEIEVALRDSKLTTKEAQETLRSNLEEIIKLEALTSGLLQLARQENTEFVKEAVPLITLVQEASDQLSTQAEQKSVKLIIKTIDKNLFAYGEPGSLRQALIILIDNAIKYSPKKSTVTLSAKSGRNSVSLVVTDKGYGIDKHDLPHVFERFYRSDKSRTKDSETNGYGLGLPIAKQIAESHGGDLTIQSTVGKGTKATLTLPKK